MFNKIGGLINYWHVIAFSKEIKKGKSIKKMIYGIPILIWRDNTSAISAIADVCSHKRSPLSIADFNKNEIICPYHGWKYNQNGALIEIPSSPHLDISKLKCNLQSFVIQEKDGFIWIYLDTKNPPKSEPFSLKTLEKWGKWSIQAPFETNEELLIENFMDATHTAYIHEGIIRGLGKKVKHSIKVNTNEEGVLVEFAETTEKIALGLNLILGSDLKVRHTDAFLFPNLVKVDYYINDIHRFNAFIACSPISEGKTQAFVRLSFNFKWLNPIIKLVLPFLAKKVLQQDDNITKSQFANQQIFHQQHDHSIDCDIIHNKVALLRKSVIKNIPISSTENTVNIHL